MTDFQDRRAINRLADKITDLERRLVRSERNRDLTHAAIDGGSGLEVVDPTTGDTVWSVAADEHGVVAPRVHNAVEPAAPAAPVLEGGLGAIEVHSSGLDVMGQPLAFDLKALYVYASTEPDFEPSTATLKGTIPVADGSTTIAVVPGTWHVALRAESTSGLRSPAGPTAMIEMEPLVDEASIREAIEQAQDVLADAHNEAVDNLTLLDERATQAEADLDAARLRLDEAEAILAPLPSIVGELQTATTELDAAAAAAAEQLGKLDLSAIDHEKRLSDAVTRLSAAESTLSPLPGELKAAQDAAREAAGKADAVELAFDGVEARLAAAEGGLTAAAEQTEEDLAALDTALREAFGNADAALKSEAASDATAKANAAREAAKTAAAADAKAKADAAREAAKVAAAADAKAKADAAQSAAEATAAADALAKANAARDAAISSAAGDATTKAKAAEDAAKAAAAADAKAKADAAQAAAISAAATDAKAKADAAQAEALRLAKLDATAKADAAQRAAVQAAAADAQEKADAAKDAAVGLAEEYADSLNVGHVNLFDASKINNFALGGTTEVMADPRWAGYNHPVEPGEVYSLSRESYSNSRFRVGYSDVEPVAGGTLTVGATSYDSDLVVEGLTVPPGVAWMFIYLDNAGNDIPRIKLERGAKATDWSPSAGDVQAIRDTAEQAVQDAAAAHTAAGSAQSSADAAMTRAGTAETNAKAHADTLPKVLHGTTAPSGTAPNGSVWFQHVGSLSGAVTGQWNRVGGQWVSTPIRSEAIANLDVGKLTAGSATVGETVTQKLLANEAVINRLTSAAAWIGGTIIKDGQITASKITVTDDLITKFFAANRALINEELVVRGNLIANNATIISAALKNLSVTEKATFAQAFADEMFAKMAVIDRLTAESAWIGGTQLEDGAVTAKKITVTDELIADMFRASRARIENELVVEGQLFAKNATLISAAMKSLSVTEKATFASAFAEELWAKMAVIDRLTAGSAWVGGAQLKDGAITANHITASESMSSKLGQFLKVKAGQIESNAFEGQTFTGGTFTGAKFQTVTNASRGVKMDNAGLKAWDDTGKLTANIDGKNNLLSGVLRTSPEGEAGLIVVPQSSGTGRPAVFFSPDGTFGHEVAAIHTTPTWNLILRGRLESGARRGVQVDGGLELLSGGITGTQARILVDQVGGNFVHSRDGLATEGSLTAGGTSQLTGNTTVSGILYANGRFRNSGAGNTSYSSNVYMDAYGFLYKSSSASRYKVDQRVTDVDDALLDLPVKEWRDKAAVDTVAELDGAMGPLAEGDALRLEAAREAAADTMFGVIAEDVEKIDRRLATYDDDGQVDGVAYDRIGPALIPIVRRQRDRITELEKQLEALASRLDAAGL